ncbi:hypothetical protein BH24BAC1_BH24BAC1_19810 [soil metagenome]
MKISFLPILAFLLILCACQPAENRQEATQTPAETAPATPSLRPDVVRLGYTSEETSLLAQPDFGAPTVMTIEPLATIEILDTSNAFFYRVRVPESSPNATGYVDRVYLSDDLETANLLYSKRGRR